MERTERRQATIRETLDYATLTGLRTLLARNICQFSRNEHPDLHDSYAAMDEALGSFIEQFDEQREIDLGDASRATMHFLAEVEAADGRYDNGLECEFKEDNDNGNS